MEFFNQCFWQLIRSKYASNILNSLVSLSICDKENIETEKTCDNRVVRLILEHAVHLRELKILTDVDDIDAAFVDVRINAPLKILELRNASDVTINALCQLGNSLTKLVVNKCNKITNDG